MSVKTLYVERNCRSRTKEASLCKDLRENLLVNGLKNVRIVRRYFAEGIDDEAFLLAKDTIFSEPQTDLVSDTLEYSANDRVFAVEYLPGQFDQRADSCSQCVQILTGRERPAIRTADIYVLEGDISDEELTKIKKYMINPVESREASFEIPETLSEKYDVPPDVPTVDGFIKLERKDCARFISEYGLAMDEDDVEFCRDYFKNEEGRDPTLTELKLIDSYWSDHCRHTTFLTEIDGVKIEDKAVKDTYEKYLSARKEVYTDRVKPVTLMDIGTLAAKYLKKKKFLTGLDESDEINACSVKIKVKTDKGLEDWILMFKNETHNHPTEIEPFGGAATCLGGAIRDPLSGRSYVYQAMRVTGAADPRTRVEDTLPGKLPQSKITVGAANGYSSYGNQIGLATGLVNEIYHPSYVAKRLEIGAVVGAAPAENIIRKTPEEGDVIILLGGRTGRDGCGGATGSSKAHTSESIAKCGAEVQKGNPPEERKLQRLFRDPEATWLIKRCNDFGAGGVSVAIGELAEGLDIDLSAVPKKYEGLDGTELAISESQERMAVVVAKEDADKFLKKAAGENLEGTVVATVTGDMRLKMRWRGKVTVDLSRKFLDSNGAKKHTDVVSAKADTDGLFSLNAKKHIKDTAKDSLISLMTDLNRCSQRGLVSRFDSSIGASTVVMPYGGKTQSTPTQFMAAKIPVLHGDTSTVSVMAYGFDPYVSEKSPYHGALYAVVESVSRMVAAGVPMRKIYLTFQEYFERTNKDPERWGKPFSALLGAFEAQTALKLAAIGGKDSMSGTFEHIDVPPTLVSFGCGVTDAKYVTSPEFKKAGDGLYLLSPVYDENGVVDFRTLIDVYQHINLLIVSGKAKSVYALSGGGVAEGVCKMSFGNELGFEFEGEQKLETLFASNFGSFLVESEEDVPAGRLVGRITEQSDIVINGEKIPVSLLKEKWENVLTQVYPVRADGIGENKVEAFTFTERAAFRPAVKFASPRIAMPVFPGTNCEYDTSRAFEKAGGTPEIFVIKNLTPASLAESAEAFAKLVKNSQILMIPGGFSGGDEPDGSGKFITTLLRNPRIREAVTELIEKRDGLVLGICNGFQALIKSGLLPYGKIMDKMTPDSPTLTFNAIGRHQSQMVNTRVASVKSPWLYNCEAGEIHTVPVSHGEGRFVASESVIRSLAENGQIATQYVGLDGVPTMDVAFNPNASSFAVEGITSPDGRIFGKMAHSERTGSFVAVNVPGTQDQKIFKSGVEYFS